MENTFDDEVEAIKNAVDESANRIAQLETAEGIEKIISLEMLILKKAQIKVDLLIAKQLSRIVTSLENLDGSNDLVESTRIWGTGE